MTEPGARLHGVPDPLSLQGQSNPRLLLQMAMLLSPSLQRACNLNSALCKTCVFCANSVLKVN